MCAGERGFVILPFAVGRVLPDPPTESLSCALCSSSARLQGGRLQGGWLKGAVVFWLEPALGFPPGVFQLLCRTVEVALPTSPYRFMKQLLVSGV